MTNGMNEKGNGPIPGNDAGSYGDGFTAGFMTGVEYERRRQARPAGRVEVERDICPGCFHEACTCPSLEEVPFGKWRSDRIRRRSA